MHGQGRSLREHAGRFLCPDEIPLRPDLRFTELELSDGANQLPKARLSDLQAIELIVANATEADLTAPGTAVFYSRDRNHYRRTHLPRRYFPDCYTYRRMMLAVGVLGSASAHRAREDGALPSRRAPVSHLG